MHRLLNVASHAGTCMPRHSPSHSGLTNVAADGRDKVVGLGMFKVESPAAELGR
jgi:hypothetical protein